MALHFWALVLECAPATSSVNHTHHFGLPADRWRHALHKVPPQMARGTATTNCRRASVATNLIRPTKIELARSASTLQVINLNLN